MRRVATLTFLTFAVAGTYLFAPAKIVAAESTKHDCATICTCVAELDKNMQITSKVSKECPRSGGDASGLSDVVLERSPQAKDGERCTINVTGRTLTGTLKKCEQKEMIRG